MTNAAFISCSSDDVEHAKTLENLLDNVGLPAWVYTQPLTGTEFPNEIVEAISTSSCVVLLISPSSVRSKWVEREVHFAIANGIPIVPVEIAATPPNSPLHFRIGALTRVNAVTGFTPPVLEELKRAIKSHYRRFNPVIAVMNMKGGVGKTTLSANIFGGLFKWRKKNVLLVDLDPQYNLTQLLVHQQNHIADVDRDRSVISAFESGQPLGRTSPARELTKISKTTLPPSIRHRLLIELSSTRMHKHASTLCWASSRSRNTRSRKMVETLMRA